MLIDSTAFCLCTFPVNHGSFFCADLIAFSKVKAELEVIVGISAEFAVSTVRANIPAQHFTLKLLISFNLFIKTAPHKIERWHKPHKRPLS